MNIPDSSLTRIVIIGAGFGGLKLARYLNKKDNQVVLIDKNNYHTFQPLLYQVATAGLEPDSIAHAIRTLFKNEKNFHFRIADVETIDTAKNTIHTNIGDLSFDKLIVATGSTTNFYGNEEIERNAMSMKTIPEALDLRSLILQNLEKALLTDDLKERKELMNFVIVGGGPTGVELAGALGELKNHVLHNDYPDLDIRIMNVHLVQSGDRLLPGFSDKASAKAEKYLRDMDVHLWLNTRVLNYDGQFVDTNVKDLYANTLIWAAGVKGDLIYGFPKDAIVDNRLKVNQFNQVEGFEHIFAIGDVACMVSEEYPHGHPMVAQPAIQQGLRLAKNLNNLSRSKPMKEFKYSDKGAMATIGRNKAVADLGKYSFSGWFAWMIWIFVHLVSLVGFRNKMVALVNWVTQYFSYNKSVRLIIRPYHGKAKEQPVMKDVEPEN
ncbi:NAD(P)/FAD-dependent oxidoreductase [Weeksellaceae bacterium KMM 9713]|uniref:NADH:ubiquinone reductase (non-electrogenic) n=1 Tax=Profundicola chukchiensis TaxID=2961959 RepID=A0A9X4RV62_9FLAO|nr:NAD(P)/FAD-dependent oxidoreductase [Profundicola chukchiensis]MDG4946351.1 NAD(P)/FAD-dependent oxidoreductase [Profundicola chukchiensis]